MVPQQQRVYLTARLLYPLRLHLQLRWRDSNSLISDPFRFSKIALVDADPSQIDSFSASYDNVRCLVDRLAGYLANVDQQAASRSWRTWICSHYQT